MEGDYGEGGGRGEDELITFVDLLILTLVGDAVIFDSGVSLCQ